jgi:hypothetical protein
VVSLTHTIPAMPVRDAAAAVGYYRDSGAESFPAETASCRIVTDAVDVPYEELRRTDVQHPVLREGVGDTDSGTSEFATLDGSLISSIQWTAA